MLENIIKRDGSIEKYDPSKLNKWAAWSSEEMRGRVDWGHHVLSAVRGMPTEASSQDLQKRLIQQLILEKRWPEQIMAGRLFAALTQKEIYGDKIPTVKELFQKMESLDLMANLDYSDEEYEEIESIIDHNRDFHMAYFQVNQICNKYGTKNAVSGESFETPQFVFMRMAMSISEKKDKAVRMNRVRSFYNSFSDCVVNSPSPGYINLGTRMRGYASCCLYATGDSIGSLDAGNTIAFRMTAASAGIGGIMSTRSIGDPVRGGKIKHNGKMGYYDATGKLVISNKTAGRQGAMNTFVSIYDPEFETLVMAQNPMTPLDKRNRMMHFTFEDNALFAKKVALDEEIFKFNIFTAPDLYEAQFDGDSAKFEEIYNRYENDPSFKKEYIKAREWLYLLYCQRNEVATVYRFGIDEANRHTPFKEPIRSSNLCVEIAEPTKPYSNIQDLYEINHERGEVATCNLGGLVITNIHSDEQYEEEAYNALDMVDNFIDLAELPLPHVQWTMQQRRHAAIGILGLAHHMARKGLRYDTPEGLQEIDRVFERHMYFLVKAALKLGKERGNAPWMHKTKWPEGWLPIDTYKKTVDELVPFELRYDWEALRAEVIANGGIRFSSLCAMMPTESSSKASGAPNGVYPVRDLDLKKSDADNLLEWCAPDNDILAEQYQLAWDVKPIPMLKAYAVMQKWMDHSISADIYRNRTILSTDDQGVQRVAPVTSSEFIEEYLTARYFGVKSEYYMNTYTNEGANITEILLKDAPAGEEAVEFKKGPNCDSGVCTL